MSASGTPTHHAPESLQVDPDLVRTVRDLFRARSTHEAVAAAERDGLSEQLWTEIASLGLHLVGVPEEAGGSGGSVVDQFAVLHAAGEYAVAAPLAETMLAATLLAESGEQVPEGALSVVVDTSGLVVQKGRVSGLAPKTSWGRSAATVVGVVEGQIFRCDTPVVARAGVDVAGLPQDDLSIDGHTVGAADGADLAALGALLRAAQMAGALEAISELTRQYVGERVQFGRPVGKFQAVQQHVVTLAQMAAMATLSAQRAALAYARGPASFEIAAAKQVIDKNASLAVRAAHQAHGAIGMTQEYRLQQLTRRLYAWRGEFGDELQLATRIGTAVAEHGGFHAVITGGSAVVTIR